MKKLIDTFDTLKIAYDNSVIEKYEAYMNGILEWNEKVNLTAITDRQEFIQKHYIDSILCNNLPEFKQAKTVVDVGTGGGFPGIPLALINLDKNFTLVDSLNKRIKIIDMLSESLGIDNVVTYHSRAEEFARGKMHREKYDVCVSRAVANLSTLAEYCLPLVKIGGYMLAYKGPDVNSEITMATRAIKILGGNIERINEVSLDGYNHNIIVIKKNFKTPAKFPRKAGTPAKEPIN